METRLVHVVVTVEVVGICEVERSIVPLRSVVILPVIGSLEEEVVDQVLSVDLVRAISPVKLVKFLTRFVAAIKDIPFVAAAVTYVGDDVVSVFDADTRVPNSDWMCCQFVVLCCFSLAVSASIAGVDVVEGQTADWVVKVD